MNRGWISLYRKIGEHDLWLEKPFSRGHAWADMLLHVDNNTCTIQFSQNYWASRWGWSRQQVNRFFTYLRKEAMIETIESGKFGERPSGATKEASKLYICNYTNYQQPATKEPTKGSDQYTIRKDITITELYTFAKHWNEKNIVHHGPQTILKAHNAFKKNLLPPFGKGDYWTDDLCLAVCNYHTVLTDPKYFWDHKWTMAEFLTRGVDKFVNGAKPLENWIAKEKYEQPTGRVTHTRECRKCRTGWHGMELTVDNLCERCAK